MAVTRQLIDLAAKLPDYQTNIDNKLHAIRLPTGGALGRLSQSVSELQKQMFCLANAASSGWTKAFLSVPPECSTSCVVTFAVRSTLMRSISKYFSESLLPSQMFSIAALVPEMISSKLFSSLVAEDVPSPVEGSF